MNQNIFSTGWPILGVAILFGVMGTVSMKLSHGLKHFIPTVCLIIFYSISFIALTLAMQYISLGVVYAVWSGVGTVLVASIGIIHFKESVSFKKIAYLLLTVAGVIGIHLSDRISSI